MKPSLRLNTIIAAIFLTFPIFTSVSAQNPPSRYADTLWIGVTFYDFHSDRSNPEFEAPHTGGVKTNMVENVLDADNKPVPGPAPYMNHYIKYWYRPWADSAKGDFSKPNYNNNGDYLGIIATDHDTAFKNFVIVDSLPFIHLGRTNPAQNGVYQYINDNFFPLDGKGFGNEGLSHNFSFTMELHRQFTMAGGLTFNFLGDDDVWAFVKGQLRMDLGGIHNSSAGSFQLDNIPGLIQGQRYDLDFYYAERHTVESHIRITTNIINIIDSLSLKADPDTVVSVYDTVHLISSVLDNALENRPDVAATTSWTIISSNANPPSVLKSQTGSNVIVVPEIAYDTITIEGVVRDELNDITLRDTIRIIVVPGKDYKVWIEADTSMEDLNAKQHPQPLDRIVISSTMTQGHGYAIVRDTSGAFTRIANPTTTEWSSLDPSLFSAQGEPAKQYHGIITKDLSAIQGENQAVATETPLIADSVLVIIAPYTIVSLRLVERGKNLITDYADSIFMNTDEKRLFDVYGLRSDATDSTLPESWVRVNADWDLSSPLHSAIQPPNYDKSWTFDPTNPTGTGTLILTNPDDSKTKTLTIPVTIVRAPPSEVTFRIITFPDTAGDTILAVVEIRNTDGLVPGKYCFQPGGDDQHQAIYQDSLGKGGDLRPDPNIEVDGNMTILNTDPSTTYKNNQCFTDGYDTVKVVLYYAPFDHDSTHRLTVTLNESLRAQTDPFILWPAKLDSLDISDDNHITIPGPVILDSRNTESITVYSTGYDKYGNLRGFENSEWNTDGTLDPKNVIGAQIYIETDNIKNHQQGNICASANGENGLARACLPIQIIGPGAQLAEAITRDSNGDGYLDRIDLTFNNKVFISNTNAAYFTVKRTSVANSSNFIVDSIVPQSAGDSIHYMLYIHWPLELRNNTPQTAWTPFVDIQSFNDVNPVFNLLTKDGAAPVVWKVVKTVGKDPGSKKDVVTIYLSEKIIGAEGAAFTINIRPDSVFNIWTKNPSTGEFTFINMFNGIESFTSTTKDSILKVTTTNGLDITTAHWVNIKWENKKLQDVSGNWPDATNQRVHVEVEGQGQDFTVFPNPLTPGFTYVQPGPINFVPEVNARKWANLWALY